MIIAHLLTMKSGLPASGAEQARNFEKSENYGLAASLIP
jgi:hypothetical protein